MKFTFCLFLFFTSISCKSKNTSELKSNIVPYKDDSELNDGRISAAEFTSKASNAGFTVSPTYKDPKSIFIWYNEFISETMETVGFDIAFNEEEQKILFRFHKAYDFYQDQIKQVFGDLIKQSTKVDIPDNGLGEYTAFEIEASQINQVFQIIREEASKSEALVNPNQYDTFLFGNTSVTKKKEFLIILKNKNLRIRD